MGVRGFFPFHVSVGVEFADRVLWLWEWGRGLCRSSSQTSEPMLGQNRLFLERKRQGVVAPSGLYHAEKQFRFGSDEVVELAFCTCRAEVGKHPDGIVAFEHTSDAAFPFRHNFEFCFFSPLFSPVCASRRRHRRVELPR